MLLTEAFDLPFSQGEVDFVIPRLDTDLPLCIDPFLLYKSRSASVRDLHGTLLGVFNTAVDLYEAGQQQQFESVIDFPEPNEIGFGYSEGAIRGSGLGAQLNGLFAQTLAASPALRERRLRHVEELQLVSINVGPDRVSDIAANILKEYLIKYTQSQAELWNIPVAENVPVNHILDVETLEWYDDYIDLPRNPVSGSAILLVPRRMVRLLPWINYDDFFSTDFRNFLRPRQTRGWSQFSGSSRRSSGTATRPTTKQDVVEVTRQEIQILDKYVTRKEREAPEATPVFVTEQDLGLPVQPLGSSFIARLREVPTGTEASASYQRLILEMLNYLFEPELTDGELEVRTIDGTERRDIVYTNESEIPFWDYVRNTYQSPFTIFEVKNVKSLEIEHVNQTAAYLGARLGTLGFIVTRNSMPDNILRKTYTVYNDSGPPRKVILSFSDEDFVEMLSIRDQSNPRAVTSFLQRRYREFRLKVQ